MSGLQLCVEGVLGKRGLAVGRLTIWTTAGVIAMAVTGIPGLSMGAGTTWDGGYGSAVDACKARIDESGAFRYSHVESNGNVAYCFVKAKKEEDGKDPSYAAAVTQDEAPPEAEKTEEQGDVAKTGASTTTEPAAAQKTAGECDDLDKLDGQALHSALLAKLQTLTDAENQALADDPKRAAGTLSENEFRGFGYTFGMKTMKDGTLTVSDATFVIMYGHVIERLVGGRVKADACLSKYLTYIKNSEQTKGRPDFEGQGKATGLLADITTSGQAVKKAKSGKPYDYILYTRLLVLDANGHAVKP